jgi:hypothetical protein
MQSNVAKFLAYYDAAHKKPLNRYLHHVAHVVAVFGVFILWRPALGVTLIASSFLLSWLGHFAFERNTPAFFDAPSRNGASAGMAKKLQVALGGLIWSAACFLRLFSLGPLARTRR